MGLRAGTRWVSGGEVFRKTDGGGGETITARGRVLNSHPSSRFGYTVPYSNGLPESFLQLSQYAKGKIY